MRAQLRVPLLAPQSMEAASGRVVQDEAESVPSSRANFANAVSHGDTVGTPAARHRTLIDGEHDSLALR